MSTEERATDPRILRTHQLLKQALASLLREKDIRKISVQDIVERASVNRATFYAHFEDKYDLIESWFHEEFQRMLMNKLSTPTSALSPKSLHALILTVFNFFEAIHSYCETPNSMSLREFDELFMGVIQREITGILSTWVQQLPLSQQKLLEPLEITTRVTSWTILGPAMQWGGETDPPSAEKMAHHVTLIATKYLSNLAIFQ